MLVTFIKFLLTILVICLPFYLWLTEWDYPRVTSLYLLLIGIFKFISCVRKDKSAVDWLMISAPIALGILAFLLGAKVGLYYPVIISIGFFVVFYTSLSTSKNFIQRIAEKVEGKPLCPQGIKYTRYVTKTWCVFFC